MSFLNQIPDHTFKDIGLKYKLFKPISEIKDEIENICLWCEKRPYICWAYSFHPEHCEKIEWILSNQ